MDGGGGVRANFQKTMAKVTEWSGAVPTRPPFVVMTLKGICLHELLRNVAVYRREWEVLVRAGYVGVRVHDVM